MLASGQRSQRNKDFLSLRLRRKSRLVPSGHIYFRKGRWKRKLTRTKGFLPLMHRDLTKSFPLISSANTGQSLSLVNSYGIIISPDFNDVILVYFQCELLVFQSTAFVVASVNGIIQASHDCSNLLYTTK